MKKIFGAFIFCAALCFGIFLCGAQSPSADTTVIVYYFHGSFRCPTCMHMEQYSKEAVEALGEGKPEFNAINVEEQGATHFVNEYQLYTKALILSCVQNGKEIKSKNLTKIWEYAHNREKFVEYVTVEIKSFLKDVQ